MQRDVIADTGAAVPTFEEALRVWVRIGILSFGGPAGQIALMHRVLVDDKRWIDEPRFLAALNFCMLLPGPEATQLATYIGWRLHGVRGGLAAGVLFVLPGAVVMLALSMLYAAFGALPAVAAAFLGVKAAVLAIVLEALLRVARRALRDPFDWLAASVAFIAIFFLELPFPLIILAAAAAGFMRGRGRTREQPRALLSVPVSGTLVTVLLWLVIWLAPIALLVLIAGRSHVLVELGLFFSKLAVVTFGGAYAVLSYMAQYVVQHYGWLTAGEMVDGLGLAETTPGPLILVTQYVGFLAGFHESGGSWAVGVLGAVVTLWVTFVPCFLWIFAGAPYLERINAEPTLKAALAMVTAAVVGVILNLTVWFTMSVLFADIGDARMGPLRLPIPDLDTVVIPAVVLSLVSAGLLLGLRQGMATTLATAAMLGLLWHVTRSALG